MPLPDEASFSMSKVILVEFWGTLGISGERERQTTLEIYKGFVSSHCYEVY